MTQPAGIDLQLNAQQYLQGSVQVMQQTAQMEQSLSRLAVATNVLNRSLDGASFSKKHSAALGSFAAAAAISQQQMSGLAATSAVTGESTAKLGNGIRALAREFPTGTQTALDTVSAINQLGLASAGSESKVISLAKTMEQLQGSSGGAAADYAPGLLQLERTFGDQGIDPKRVSATADALVSVSKNVGASVQGTLAFANAIGPVAQSAGVGKLATLGIGAAMTSIGQDGTAAGTAISKMLADMSKAVRDGGPQMNTYADIVGMTADNFKKMYKNNPAAAIEEVTTAIGKAGQQGPRILENLGLDGVRTFRSLQALSASGRLTTSVNEAISGAGSGANAKASNAAFSGVLDKFTEVSTSAGQVATALGRPLLGGLGLFAAALSGVTKRAASLVDNRWVKDALNVAGGLLVARRVFGLGLTGALVRQGVTSGPVLSPLAGYRAGLGQTVQGEGRSARLGGLFGRGAAGIQAAQNAIWINPATGQSEIDPRTGQPRTVLASGAMGGIRGRLYDFGLGAGQKRAAQLAERESFRATQEGNYILRTYGVGSAEHRDFAARQAAGEPVPQLPLRSRVRAAFVTAGRAYSAVNQATFDAASTPVMGRLDANGQPIEGTTRTEAIQRATAISGGAFARAGGAVGRAIAAPFRPGVSFADEAQSARDSLKALGKEVTNSTGTFRGLGRSLASLSQSTGRFGLQSAGQAIGGTASALGWSAKNLGSMMLGPQGILMGGLALGGFALNRMHASAAYARAESERTGALTPTSTVDKYNESIGRAAESTSTFADMMTQNTKLTVTAVTSLSQALKVSASDVSNAAQGKNVVTYDAQATNSQIAAMVRQSSVGGLDAQQVQSIKEDLIRQFGGTRAQSVLGQIGTGGIPISASGAPDLTKLALQAGNISVNEPGNPDSNRVTESYYYGAGSSMWKPKLKSQATNINDTILQSIQQRYGAQQQNFGTGFASQTQMGDINQVMSAVAKQGNEAEVNQLGDELAQNLLGFTKGGYNGPTIPRITSSDIRKFGSYTQALVAKDPKFKQYLSQMGLDTSGKGSFSPTGQLSPLAQRFTAKSLGGTASPLMGFFDNTMTAQFGGTGSASFAPGARETRALLTGAGSSSAMGTAGPSAAMFAANRTMAASLNAPENVGLQEQAQNALVSTSLSSGTSWKKLGDSIAKVASTIDDDTNPAFNRLIGSLGRMGEVLQAAAPFQGTGQSQAMLASLATSNLNVKGTSKEAVDARATGKSQGLQFEQTFSASVKQQLMAEHGYQVQSIRGLYDYQVQYWNATTDFNLQKSRAVREFGINQARAEADYDHQRLISTRDFNKQIAREVQDAAQSVYDPYKRIQTKATWDTQSLLANMAEQNAAVVKQNQQLKDLRAKGLSEAAIQQLKLNDPANAQQLAQLSGDLRNNPGLMAQINKTSAAGIAAGTTLTTDPSNKALARAKADFATQLSDMKYTFDVQTKRAKADIERQTGDMVHDFGVQMTRMTQQYQTAQFRLRQDVTDGEREMVLNIKDTWAVAQDLMQGKYVETGQFMQNTLGQQVQWLKDNNMGEIIAGQIGMMDANGNPVNFAGMKITVTASPVTTNDTTATMGASAAGSYAPAGGRPAASPTNNPAGDPRWNTGTRGAGGRSSGDGGLFTSPQLRYIAERGPEVVLPLSGQGTSMLAEALSRAQISHPQLNRMNTAGHNAPVQYVTHTESHVSDYSTHIDGPITVQAQDPDTMLRKMDAKKRASALVPSGKRQRP